MTTITQPTDTIRTDPKVALDVKLQSHRQHLAMAKREKDAFVADNLDIPPKIFSTIQLHQQGIEDCLGGLAELARRAEAMTATEKAAGLAQAAAINFNVRQQLRALVVEETRLIADQQDWGRRTMATVTLARGLGDDALIYECAQITRGLRFYLGYALRQFPGMDGGVTPFLKLDEKTFESVFPEPVDPATASKKSRKKFA